MITTISQFKQTINENVMADKNYTHFAIHIATGQIMNAWNYKGYDKDDLNGDKGYYFLGDLKDQFPDEKINGKTVKIITRKSLDSAGIDPENIENWYRPWNIKNEAIINEANFTIKQPTDISKILEISKNEMEQLKNSANGTINVAKWQKSIDYLTQIIDKVKTDGF